MTLRLLLQVHATLSLTLMFEKLLLLHMHAALSVKLKLGRLLLLQTHAALSLKVATQVRVACR
jgi:hypothetical protein